MSPSARCRLIERNRKAEIAALQLAHETKVEAAKAALKKWKDEVAQAIEAGQGAPPKPAQALDIKPFVAPRLYVNDSTIERLAPLLEARPRGIIYIADELARLFLNMQRYSNGSDREFWLEAWDGGSYVVERQGRPPIVVPYLAGRGGRRFPAGQVVPLVRGRRRRHLCSVSLCLAA